MSSQPSKRFSEDKIYLIALSVVLLFIIFIRWRLLALPLERDEGEYAYVGKLILDGIAPYKETYNMKLPGTYYMYAILMAVFGKSITGVHLGLLLTNVLTVIILFAGFRKLFNSPMAFFAASVYGLMSLSPNVQGFAAHATHFVNLFVAIGVYVFASALKKPAVMNIAVTGLMFGFGLVMKQQAVFFILFGWIMTGLLAKMQKINLFKIVAAFFIGAVIPYLLVVLIVYAAGTQDKFWFWTFQYAIKYATGGSDPETAFAMSFEPMWDEYWFVWLLGIAGFVLTFFSKLSNLQKSFIIFFAVFSFLSICPGFYFRPHYFISLLPALSLVVAVALQFILQRGRKGVAIAGQFVLLVFISFNAVSKNKDYYLYAAPNELSKMLYGANPFVESIEIAKYIRAHSSPRDKIAILGSEPELLFYADRPSATGYIYTYSLMEPQPYNFRMQKEMIAEIEQAKPAFVVFYRVNSSWLIRPDSPLDIMQWAVTYTDKNYKLEGVAEVWGIDEYVYKWGNEAANYKPLGKDYVLIFSRNK